MAGERILIIDDEPQITRVLRRSLMAHQYEVRIWSDGEYGLELFYSYQPDLVITDLSMPEMDGIEVCSEIRKSSQVPIIILSVKGEEKSKVEALDAGADDYITKPFGMKELLARVRANLRRSPGEKEVARIQAGDFSIDLAKHQIYIKDKEIHLTPKEFELLAYLIKNDGKVMTHRSLLGAIWGGNSTEQPEYLRVFIGNLRKKIEVNPSTPIYILTEPWIGYRFNSES
ncbi:MAG: response regulator transcription factor [Acidobacteria bacterium]|nr:response regulator transcription factor [Acidobacteriota bacterium]